MTSITVHITEKKTLIHWNGHTVTTFCQPKHRSMAKDCTGMQLSRAVWPTLNICLNVRHAYLSDLVTIWNRN